MMVAQQWNVFNTTGLYTEKLLRRLEEGIKEKTKSKIRGVKKGRGRKKEQARRRKEGREREKKQG